MKKTTLLTLLLFTCICFAQVNLKTPTTIQQSSSITPTRDTEIVIFNEDFDAWPNGWSIDSETGSTATGEGAWHHNTDSSDSYARLNFVNSTMVHNEWLISPSIDIPTGVTKLQWDWNASYFWMVDPNENGDLNVYISNNNGATWSASIWSENTEGVFENYEWYTKVIDVSSYANETIKVAFVYDAVDSAHIGIDKVQVYTVDTIDAELISINTPTYITLGTSLSIEGTIYNNGTDNITSYDVSYNIDGGSESTNYAVTTNLAFSESENFTHNVPYNFATIGDKTINMTISNINGGNDSNLTNNVSSKLISVPTQAVLNVPLFESFTSSTCFPCAPFNQNIFNPFMDTHDDIAVVKYQMSWPAPGDDYYTVEGGTRRTYYNINSIPAMVTGGNQINTSSGAVNSSYNTQIATDAYFSIDASFSLVGNTITVNTEITPYISGTFTVHKAIIEKITTGNVSSNGENAFENVMMKMLPNGGGTQVSFLQETPYSINESFDMSSTNVEELSDLALVVFIQDDSNSSVLQSRYVSEASLGLDNQIFETVSLYPNPSNGHLNIKTTKELQLKITDTLGRIVISNQTVNDNDILDLSELNSGIYFIAISNGNEKGVQKLILNK